MTVGSIGFSCSVSYWQDASVSWCEALDSFLNFLVTNVTLLGKCCLFDPLEFWVQNSIIGVLFSWICSWVHAVVFVDESVDGFVNFFVTNIHLLGKGCWICVLLSIKWISLLLSFVWCWKDTLVVCCEAVDFFSNTRVTNVLLFFLCKIEPLPWWVFESIDLIGLSNSSPWFWEDWFITWSKAMNSLIDFLITNISHHFSSTLLRKPLPWWVLESINWIRFLNTSPWLWKDWFIVCSKLLNFLSDSFISNVLC